MKPYFCNKDIKRKGGWCKESPKTHDLLIFEFLCDFPSENPKRLRFHSPHTQQKKIIFPPFLGPSFLFKSMIRVISQRCAQQQPQWSHPRTYRGLLLHVKIRFVLTRKSLILISFSYRPYCAWNGCGCGASYACFSLFCRDMSNNSLSGQIPKSFGRFDLLFL